MGETVLAPVLLVFIPERENEVVVVLALVVFLLIVAVAVIASFAVGFYCETCWAMTRNADSRSREPDGYWTLVVLVPVKVHAAQWLLGVLIALALGWALVPVAGWIGDEGGVVFILAPLFAAAIQMLLLDRVVRFASDLSVAGVDDLPVLRRTVRPESTYAVAKHW